MMHNLIEKAPGACDTEGLPTHTISCKISATCVHFEMKALFVELPPFQRYRADYLDDQAFSQLQAELMKNPQSGSLIEGTGGLRKVRFADGRRGKGKRGGLRVIYFYWDGKSQFWLFTVYGKDEMDDLAPKEKAALKLMLKAELESRK